MSNYYTHIYRENHNTAESKGFFSFPVVSTPRKSRFCGVFVNTPWYFNYIQRHLF